jgi:hypothetical protein
MKITLIVIINMNQVNLMCNKYLLKLLTHKINHNLYLSFRVKRIEIYNNKIVNNRLWLWILILHLYPVEVLMMVLLSILVKEINKNNQIDNYRI